MNVLAFDVGGTSIKYMVCDEFGNQISHKKNIRTAIYENSNKILDQIINIVLEEKLNYKLDGIAIATAGVVNSDGHIEYSGYTIPGYTGTPIKSEVERICGLPCVVLNDANAAALGEFWKGSYTSHDSIVYLTFGTGVGGGIILNGQLYSGKTGLAGEIGYMPVKGRYFQDIASATALVKKCKEITGQTVNGKQFFDELSHNEIYQTLLEEFVDNITEGILVFLYALNPAAVVLGGGIMEQPILLEKLELNVSKKIINERFNTSKLKLALLGNDAGMIGAVKYFLQKKENAND